MIEQLIVMLVQASLGGQVVVIRGPAGTGKSTNLSKFAARRALTQPEKLDLCVTNQNVATRALADTLSTIVEATAPLAGVMGRLPGYQEGSRPVSTPLDMTHDLAREASFIVATLGTLQTDTAKNYPTLNLTRTSFFAVDEMQQKVGSPDGDVTPIPIDAARRAGAQVLFTGDDGQTRGGRATLTQRRTTEAADYL